jgi:dTDP-4-dehydrorhamnose reductase
MAEAARIAVTGVGGRLGTALRTVASADLLGWDLPELDLDHPESVVPMLERDRPALVIHAAAMTDVDACARDPELAMRRNGAASGAIAQACRDHAAGLLIVSTNEVFSGDRSDGQGYRETDATGPRNPYGASKLAGEEAARAAFGDQPGLWIVRTAWLFGAPGGDFPDRITAAADRLPVEEPLPVVADEFGSPTSTSDLARGILDLVARTDGGTFHLVNAGVASRREYAEAVLAVRRPGRATRPISRTAFTRASEPPPWGVLDASGVDAVGVRLRPWQEALEAYLLAGAQATKASER